MLIKPKWQKSTDVHKYILYLTFELQTCKVISTMTPLSVLFEYRPCYLYRAANQCNFISWSVLVWLLTVKLAIQVFANPSTNFDKNCNFYLLGFCSYIYSTGSEIKNQGSDDKVVNEFVSWCCQFQMVSINTHICYPNRIYQ